MRPTPAAHSLRNFGCEPLAARRPSAQTSDIGPGPGLVDDDLPLRFDATLIFCPPSLTAHYLGTIEFTSSKELAQGEIVDSDPPRQLGRVLT